MADHNEIAALLHIEEKLRVHGNKYPNMLNAVRQKLDEYEAEHVPAKPVEEEPAEEVEEEETETKPERRL